MFYERRKLHHSRGKVFFIDGDIVNGVDDQAKLRKGGNFPPVRILEPNCWKDGEA
ncbi:hypothetical protein C0993_012108, partial [Termitomyces sp. T159_Od127]